MKTISGNDAVEIAGSPPLPFRENFAIYTLPPTFYLPQVLLPKYAAE